MLFVFILHAVIISDGLRVVLLVDPNGKHLTWVFIFAFINSALYIVCCHSNPGELSSSSTDKLLMDHALTVYPYDELLYHPRVICKTCILEKPARSKHCRKSLLITSIVRFH